jgi:hypothetical protein
LKSDLESIVDGLLFRLLDIDGSEVHLGESLSTMVETEYCG